MTKGSIILKDPGYARWVKIFQTWWNSGHIAVVIHGKDKAQLKTIRESALRFRRTRQYDFWIEIDGLDLYLIRNSCIKECAMEVQQSKDGAIYFYDTAKLFYRRNRNEP